MPKLELRLFTQTWSRFGEDNASMLAAAIAYSTVFALAPLLIVAIGIVGGILGLASGGHQHHVIESQLIGALQSSVGAAAAKTVRDIVDASFASHSGSLVAQIVGWVTFVIAAMGLFASLQTALNTVWRVKPKQRGIWLTIRERAASAAMLLVIGFLILVTTAINVVLSFMWTHVSGALPSAGAGVAASVLNWIVEAAIVSLMFALMFKYLPDTEIDWADVRVGALFSGVLFVFGQTLLSIYLSHAGIANGYGAAGSLVVILVWVYYSAMLLLLGAEFTQVWSARKGSRSPAEAAPSANGASAMAAPRSR